MVTPSFGKGGEIQYVVASRAHHADVGGVTPGSVPPLSRTIDEEGVLLDGVRIVADGRFLEAWEQFGMPGGVFIDANDRIYVADSLSDATTHPGWIRGIRIGNARDGRVTAFIPDPVEKTDTTSAAEGVAADAAGNIYGAEVGPKRMMKYVRN